MILHIYSYRADQGWVILGILKTGGNWGGNIPARSFDKVTCREVWQHYAEKDAGKASRTDPPSSCAARRSPVCTDDVSDSMVAAAAPCLLLRRNVGRSDYCRHFISTVRLLPKYPVVELYVDRLLGSLCRLPCGLRTPGSFACSFKLSSERSESV